MPKQEHPKECQGCPQLAYSQGFVAPDGLHSGARVVFYGETPGEEEVWRGSGFVGPAGLKLRVAAARAGLQTSWPDREERTKAPGPSEFLCANVILCRPPGNKWPGDGVARECLARHQATHARLRANLPVVSFGANATRALTDWDFSPIGMGRSPGHRGSLLPMNDGSGKWLVGSIHPSYLARGEGEELKAQDHLLPLLVHDIVKAMESPGPVCPDVRLVDHWKLEQLLHEEKPRWLAVDLESSDGKPVLAGFSWKANEAWCVLWTEGLRTLVEELCTDPSSPTLIFHNAAFDLGEIRQQRILQLPSTWVDTINLSACVDASLPQNLQSLALSYISTASLWKDLVTHQGRSSLSKTLAQRKLWSGLLSASGKSLPASEIQWLAFYCGLDTTYTYQLALALREELGEEGMAYYREFIQANQRGLLEMGWRGLPVDESRAEWHQRACLRLERMAKRVLDETASGMLAGQLSEMRQEIARLEEERRQELEAKKAQKGDRKFSKAGELSKLRGRIRVLEDQEGFNFDSHPQRKKLLQDHMGIPLSKGRGTKDVTTNDKALEEILRQVREGKLDKKLKLGRAKTEQVLIALSAGKGWATWRRNFLERVLEER